MHSMGGPGEASRLWPLIGAIACLAFVPAGGGARARAHAPPIRYAHVVVIVEENKDFELIIDPKVAPNIARLAKTYGVATAFYGGVHPSEANYVALLGGDTLGIHDDDPFYCKPGSIERLCAGAARPGYTDHTSDALHLGDQLQAKGLSWKGSEDAGDGRGDHAPTGPGEETLAEPALQSRDLPANGPVG